MFLGGSCGILSTGLGLRLLSASVRMYVLVQRTLVWYVPGTGYQVVMLSDVFVGVFVGVCT